MEECAPHSVFLVGDISFEKIIFLMWHFQRAEVGNVLPVTAL